MAQFNYFTGTKPDFLINPTTLVEFDSIIAAKPPNSALYNRCSYCYTEYIQPNIFFILFMIVFILVLIYRYMTKAEDDLYRMSRQDNFVPTFQPNIPVRQQMSYTNYMPDNTPVLSNAQISHINSFTDIDEKYNSIYNKNININNLHKSDFLNTDSNEDLEHDSDPYSEPEQDERMIYDKTRDNIYYYDQNNNNMTSDFEPRANIQYSLF